MLLSSAMPLTVLVLLLTLTRITRGSQPCPPRCFPKDQKTRTDCLTFHKLSPCFSSRPESNPSEAGCACLWVSSIRRTGPFQDFLDSENGILCLAWALKNCERGLAKGTKTDDDELNMLPELLSIDDLNEANQIEDTDGDMKSVLTELDQRLQKLEGSKKKIADEDSDPKAEMEQPTLNTGEVYGELNKNDGTLHAAERIGEGKDEQDLTDMIGPALGKNKWWLWDMKNDTFKLFIFSLIILFVVFCILIALSCVGESGSEKNKKETRKRGDLDPDVYRIQHRKSSFLPKSDSFTKLEKKRTQFQHFIDKLRAHRRNKAKKLEDKELEMFHAKMRKECFPEYRPRQSTPVETFQKRMVRVGVQTPIYDPVEPAGVSDYDEVIYERDKSPDSTFNTTYEQPFPIHHRESIPQDPIYYNDTLSEERHYTELIPAVIEENQPESVRTPRTVRLLDLPPDIDETQRVLLPTQSKGKKSKRPLFMMLPISRAVIQHK